jgi:hypothetical protein
VANSKEVTKTSLELIQETAERIRNDPVELKKFMRKILGPDRRKITGQEHDYMLTVFQLIEPIESSNNQRSWTDVYQHAGKTYHVHYFEDETEIEEILPDDFQ